jgi:predicted DNA-binding antitoxin AbrB/MazE fold protein
MTHTVEAIYDHGVFRPTVPLSMPEGTRVQLRVEEENGTAQSTEHGDSEGPSLFERLKDVVGSIDDLPADSSENLDHYLYGQPKR